jgi:hypothetical protein
MGDNGKVPAQGARRDSSPHQGVQLDQDLDALHRTAPVEHVTDIAGWQTLAAWLGAAT